MFNLIITVLAIGLVAALAMASITYVPWHIKPAENIAKSAGEGLERVQDAYRWLSAAGAGAAPDPQGTPAAAFQSTFVDKALKLTPPVPPGYQWTYHKFPSDGTKYADLHYVCLEPANALPADKALELGLRKALVTLSQEQAILADTCGATQSKSTFVAAPVLTFFLVPTLPHSL